jgi:sec-independent protein translocase protein TatA
MGIGNLGFGEILIILLIVLLLFGAKRIPEIASSMGKGIRDFKKSLNDVQDSVAGELAPREDRDRVRGSVPPASSASESETRAEPKRLLQ